MKTKNTVKHTHPGRPRYIMLFPKSLTFTFTALMAANGVDTRRTLGNGKENDNYGKGDNATMLTIRKNLKHAIKQGTAFLLKGFTAVPDSDGLGRRGLLYMQTSTDFDRALAQAKVRGAEGVEVDDAVKADWAKAEVKLAEGFEKARAKAAKLAAAPAPKATRKAVVHKGKSKSTAPTSTAEYEAQKASILAPVVTIAPAVPSTIPDAVHNPIVAPAAETAPVIPVAPTPEPVVAAAPVETAPAPAPEAPVAVEQAAPVAA